MSRPGFGDRIRQNGAPWRARRWGGEGAGASPVRLLEFVRFGMNIRDARGEDFEQIAALTNHYIVHTSIHFGISPVSPDELRAGWEQARAKYPFVVGEFEDGTIAGYAKAGVWRERAAYSGTAELGVYVRHGLIGKGYGTALYRRVIEDCRQRGFHTLVGGVTMPNPESEALHERLGFRRVGVFEEVGRKFDRWHGVIWYQLILSGA